MEYVLQNFYYLYIGGIFMSDIDIKNKKLSAKLPQIRVSDQELYEVKQRADLSGLTITDYLRNIIFDRTKNIDITSNIKANIILELHNIGLTLLKNFDSLDEISQEKTRAILDDIQAIISGIYSK